MDVVRVDGDDAVADNGLRSINKASVDGGDEFVTRKMFVATGRVGNCRQEVALG